MKEPDVLNCECREHSSSNGLRDLCTRLLRDFVETGLAGYRICRLLVGLLCLKETVQKGPEYPGIIISPKIVRRIINLPLDMFV